MLLQPQTHLRKSRQTLIRVSHKIKPKKKKKKKKKE